jgi:hypothetical protein
VLHTIDYRCKGHTLATIKRTAIKPLPKSSTPAIIKDCRYRATSAELYTRDHHRKRYAHVLYGRALLPRPSPNELYAHHQEEYPCAAIPQELRAHGHWAWRDQAASAELHTNDLHQKPAMLRATAATSTSQSLIAIEPPAEQLHAHQPPITLTNPPKKPCTHVLEEHHYRTTVEGSTLMTTRSTDFKPVPENGTPTAFSNAPSSHPKELHTHDHHLAQRFRKALALPPDGDRGHRETYPRDFTQHSLKAVAPLPCIFLPLTPPSTHPLSFWGLPLQFRGFEVEVGSPVSTYAAALHRKGLSSSSVAQFVFT